MAREHVDVEGGSRAKLSFQRTLGGAAVLLATSYLIFSSVFSYLAPLGSWQNQIFGKTAWGEWDPGGPYVDAAHQLSWGGGQLFEGHPGTVLILLLSALQHAYYAVAGSTSGFSFTEFTARHLPAVFLLSKLMMTLLHLVACYATFLLAHRVLRDARAAAFSAFGYATSLPVGYYLSRISVEPLVVIFFVLSLLAIFRYQDLTLKQRPAAALAFAAMSGAAAVSGAVTKLNFLAPLIPFLALYIALGGWREGNRPATPWRIRALGLLVFAATTAGLLLLYSQLIDWGSFFRLWKLFTFVKPPPPWTLTKLTPGFAPDRAFLLCDLGYIVLGVLGWIAFLRTHSEQRMRALWLSAYGIWGLLLFGYRIKGLGSLLPFHYFHLSNVVIAVFFGHAVMLVIKRLPVREQGWRAAGFGLLAIAVLHAATFWTVIDSRLSDAARYRPNRSIHNVIANLKPEQRLACLECPQEALGKGTGLHALSATGWTTGMNPEARSHLAREFASLFVPVKAADVDPRARRIRVDVLKTAVVVLDGSTKAGYPAESENTGAGPE